LSPGSTRKPDSRVPVSWTQTRSRTLVPTQKPSLAATSCTRTLAPARSCRRTGKAELCRSTTGSPDLGCQRAIPGGGGRRDGGRCRRGRPHSVGSAARSWVARSAPTTSDPVPATVAWPEWSWSQPRTLHGLDQAEREEASQRTTAFGQGIAQGRAYLAVEQVPSGIEGALTAAIPGRQGVEDRLAAVSRQVDGADGQEIVDPELGPCPRELRGHGPGCRPELCGKGGGVAPSSLATKAVRSRAGRRANPSAIARTSSCCNARSSGRSGSRRSTRRCRWRFSVWRPRTNETATLRARTTANGARASSSSRGLAWRSRAKVSCTRSSTTCGSLTRAATTRRISGVSARRSCCCWVSEVGAQALYLKRLGPIASGPPGTVRWPETLGLSEEFIGSGPPPIDLSASNG
jgi:hypothetical protein